MFLITGGAGYIGSHMALRFLEDGKEIVIFDNLETGNMDTIERLKKVSDKLHFIKGDLRNKEDILNVFKSFKIEGVFHFAAYSIVGESVLKPEKYWRNNVFGTLNLLDAMVENNVDKIVFSSTCATYGEPKYIPLDEGHPQNPINPYGETKLAVEKIMDDYDRAYGIKSVRLRYFNAAGADKKARIGEKHKDETHLIPNILKAAKNGDTLKVFGNTYNTKDGTCIRDYIDVDDLIEAHVKAFEYLKNTNKTDFFNIGTSEGNSVLEVFETVKNITGKELKYEVTEKREGDPAVLICNGKKAKETLHFEAKVSLKESVESAYNWYKSLL